MIFSISDVSHRHLASEAESFFKKFLLVYDSYIGDFLVTFPPFLNGMWRVPMFHIHTQTYSPHFTLFIYPPPPMITLFLTWPVSHSCLSFLKCLFVVQWKFHLVFLPVYILCFNQSNPPSITLPHPFPPILYCSTVFSVSVCNSFTVFSMFCLVPTQMWCISLLFTPYCYTYMHTCFLFGAMSYICMYVCVCMYTYMLVFVWIHLPHGRNHVTLSFLNLAYFT
jgi:hypothetical protein